MFVLSYQENSGNGPITSYCNSQSLNPVKDFSVKCYLAKNRNKQKKIPGFG